MASPAVRSLSSPLADWAEDNIRLDGRPFSFERHEYLRGIYNDVAQHIVLSKAAQIGGTVFSLLKSIHACLQGLDVVYFFPTRTDVLDFSKSRISPLIADNPFLSKQVIDTDTAGLKRIGEGFLHLRGMQSTVGMKSVPADMLVFDELDEAAPEAKSMAKERLAHSDYKRIIELSNPSLPDYGVDEVYLKSDQRHWTLQCWSCGTWTALDKAFPTKLGQEVRIILPRPDGTFYRACPKCTGELDLAAGEWVADFPDRKIHGYRISQLFASTVDPGEILGEYRTTRYADRFYNLKIGIPWSDLERRLDPSAVLGLCGDQPMVENCSQGETFMGVDTGKALHVVILRRRESKPKHEVIHLCEVQSFEDLEGLWQKFNVFRCVIDGLPETHATREFAKGHRARAFMSFFEGSQRGGPAWDYPKQMVKMNRTDALDLSRTVVREGDVLLPRRTKLIEEFAEHLSSDAKVLKEDPETGVQRYRYIKTGTNHFSLAFTYAMLSTMGIKRAGVWGRRY